MLVRLGYVSIAKTIYDDNSFKTINYANFKKNNDISRIDDIILNNLDNLKKIISYNIKNNIHFYRITSDLIPLATLDDVVFDYINKFNDYYKDIGELINLNNMRVDMHPSEYTVLNSAKSEVVVNTCSILKYHYDLLNALGTYNPFLILHVGSNAFGKKNSLTRFINNFNLLDSEIRNCIGIENDDKVFNVDDVLYLCKVLKVPFVLDYHHHVCNPTDKDITYYLNDIFETWSDKVPKVHFSSPKNKTKREMRSHNDYINPNDFIKFLELVKPYTESIDIMLEAKMKDEALFRLVRQLKFLTNYRFIDDSTFII